MGRTVDDPQMEQMGFLVAARTRKGRGLEAALVVIEEKDFCEARREAVEDLRVCDGGGGSRVGISPE